MSSEIRPAQNNLVPIADKAEIGKAVEALFGPADLIELRAFHKGRKRTDAGYFDRDHRDKLAEEAKRLSATGAAVYVTLNQLDPQLLSRYANRVQKYASATATDSNVIKRRWLLLDFDPIRPKDTSSTDEQLEAAKDSARRCYQALKRECWPDPLAAESGNGMHLLYPLDLPNDAESCELVKGALAGLAQRFDTESVTLDQAVSNAARIVKLYGTVARKGDHTAAAPWRLSRLVSTPARDAVVTMAQLQALHPPPEPQPINGTSSHHSGSFDLEDFLSRLGIGYTQDIHAGSERYKLDHCPFDADHGRGEAAIFRSANGVLGFKCQHNSCAEYHWQDVRALVDAPREMRTRPLAIVTPLSVGQSKSSTLSLPNESTAWPEPLPLVTDTQLEPYPIDALPADLGAAVREVVDFVQCPFPLAACSALSVLSLAGQALANVRRADKLVGPCSLYFLSVAESGERKSTCDEFFSLPVEQWERAQAQKNEPISKEREAQTKAWTAKCEGLQQAIKNSAKSGKPTAHHEQELKELEATKPQAGRVPMLIYGDSTSEGLAWHMVQGWPYGGVLSSEAGIVFGSHAMGHNSIMRNLALLNSLWDGRGHKVHRRTSESFNTYGLRLSMGLAVQPDVARAFFEFYKGLARGSGFAARFLIAWPESTQGRRLFRDAPAGWPHVSGFSRRICTLLDQLPTVENKPGDVEFPVLDLSPEAQTVWVHFHDDVERELAPGGDMTDIRDVASKAADNAARLAALFHIFEHGPNGPISAAHMQAAARIVTWHLYQAQRFLSSIELPKVQSDAVKLDTWLLKYCHEHGVARVSPREIQQYGPASLRDKTRRDNAIAELIDAGRVRQVKQDGRCHIELNPALLTGVANDAA